MDVEIVRDNYGVPHIYGKTDADVAYGLAWAHSEDDFKTIQEAYLAGNGLLSKHIYQSLFGYGGSYNDNGAVSPSSFGNSMIKPIYYRCS